MWTLDPVEFLRFRTSEGRSFTRVVDALIRALAYAGGLPQSEINTNLRTNLPDGGVDTDVRDAIPNDSTGWFKVPTCWQYKATEAASISEAK
jgi:hypothetical protein